MTTMRGIGQRQGGNNAPSQQQGGGRGAVDVRHLDAESQRAHELLSALSALGDQNGRRKILARAGATEPLTPRSLSAVAVCMARLDMPLNTKGITRFKADRGLVGGSALAGSVARAYVRAIDGGEVLFRIDRKEELDLRPGDKAVLNFLRALAKGAGAEAVGRLKEALGLGNPPTPSPDAAALMNEYIGVNTVREVARVTTLHKVPLESGAVKALVEKLEAEKAAAEAASPTGPGAPKPKPAPSFASPPRTQPSSSSSSSPSSSPASQPSSASLYAAIEADDADEGTNSASRPAKPMVPGRGLRKPASGT
jgi:hypothetical protein